MKMKISVGRYLKRKTIIVWVKEYIIKNFVAWNSLCDLQELYATFKEKHPYVNIGLSKFCVLRHKWWVLTGSKMTHAVCVCGVHQNVLLLVNQIDWDLTYKDLIKTDSKDLINTDSSKCIMDGWQSCPDTGTLKEFLYQELNEHEDDEKFNYCQWVTRDWAILTTFTPLTKNTKIHWLMLLII